MGLQLQKNFNGTNSIVQLSHFNFYHPVVTTSLVLEKINVSLPLLLMAHSSFLRQLRSPWLNYTWLQMEM